MAKLRPISTPVGLQLLAVGLPMGLQVQWPLALLAVLATVVTIVLLVSLLRGPGQVSGGDDTTRHRERRRAPVAGRRDAREALALVGDALAATHNPRALLPVILNVITEATGARGGQLIHEGREIGWVGEIDDQRDAVEFDLSAGDETRATTLVLYPPPGGFGDERTKLATWLSSQAGIALENARLHDIVQRQAVTDELTGLVNRRGFLDALRMEIARAERLGGPVSVLLLDLDDFKLINDRFGHHGGDEVLQAFANVIRAHSRDVDVAARLGGEEFAVLLPETELRGAAAGAERLCAALAQLRIWLGSGQQVSVTASFGVAELTEGQSWEDLLRVADDALYRAKAEGKNRVVLAGPPPAA
jgi:diguanylate cyclase (GGDEF)-like protein